MLSSLQQARKCNSSRTESREVQGFTINSASVERPISVWCGGCAYSVVSMTSPTARIQSSGAQFKPHRVRTSQLQFFQIRDFVHLNDFLSY